MFWVQIHFWFCLWIQIHLKFYWVQAQKACWILWLEHQNSFGFNAEEKKKSHSKSKCCLYFQISHSHSDIVIHHLNSLINSVINNFLIQPQLLKFNHPALTWHGDRSISLAAIDPRICKWGTLLVTDSWDSQKS